MTTATARESSKALGRTSLLIVPPEPGRKSSHLVLISHKGGGWYTAACMGQAKRCRAGECAHARGIRWADSDRLIRQVAR